MKLIPSIAFLGTVLAGFSACNAQVTGTVTVDGVAPANHQYHAVIAKTGGGAVAAPIVTPLVTDRVWAVGSNRELANVLVCLQSDDPERLRGPMPASAASITADAFVFTPRVLGVMCGQELKFKNVQKFPAYFHGNPFYHEVFAFGVATNGEKTIKLKRAETFLIKSDYFSWQRAWICCLPHPFFAVSGSDGKYVIDPAPPDGEYVIIAWHETDQTQKKTVQIKSGKAAVDFAIKPLASTPNLLATPKISRSAQTTSSPVPATQPGERREQEREDESPTKKGS